jgi:hypothetical protein
VHRLRGPETTEIQELHMRRLFRGAVAVAIGATAVLFTASPAFAHEQRQVGAYQFTVGWAQEPTYVGQENSVQLFLHDAKGNPIDDLGSPPTIQVEAIFGSQTSAPLDLEPSFDPDTGLGTHGEFDASMIPTAVGDYTFHFFGTLNGQKVDQKFTSGPTTFNTVVDPSAVELPAKIPTVPELSTLTSRLGTRVASAQSLASSSRSKADSATTLAIIGIAVGAAGLLVGGLVGLTGMRRGLHGPAAERQGAGAPS